MPMCSRSVPNNALPRLKQSRIHHFYTFFLERKSPLIYKAGFQQGRMMTGRRSSYYFNRIRHREVETSRLAADSSTSQSQSFIFKSAEQNNNQPAKSKTQLSLSLYCCKCDLPENSRSERCLFFNTSQIG